MIEKITPTGTVSKGTAENSDWARGRRLLMTKEVDDKLNARAGFRNETGVSQAEYAKQAQIARKMGFAAVLATEMNRK